MPWCKFTLNFKSKGDKMSLNADLIQKANEIVGGARCFKMSELAECVLNLTQEIKLTKKLISEDEQELDEIYYKDTFGAFGGVAKTIGYAAKTALGLDEYNEIDEDILQKFEKLEDKFHKNYLPELLYELCKDHDKDEKEAIDLAIKPLVEIGLDSIVNNFYWALTQVQTTIALQNCEAGVGGSSKVNEMKEALKQLQATAQNVKTAAAEYDLEMSGVKF